MCTLILGLGTVGRDSVILAANRDEDPTRPSAPPAVLRDDPRVVGGRDLRKGGTWLALRGARAAVAVLNRRPPPGAGEPARSRGLLALEVAAAGDGSADAALEFAEPRARGADFAPFSLLFASPEACWLLVKSGLGPAETVRIAPGWHAITHEDLDDAKEPRTRWLLGRLARFVPAGRAAAERGLLDLLSSHGDESSGAPPVCLHAGPMRTVSSSIVYLGADGARYMHIEGRPCTGVALDSTHLLAAGAPARADRP